MSRKNYALDWYVYGLKKKDDAIIKFMMHWIAFNWLYSECRPSLDTPERKAIETYCQNHYNELSSFKAFTLPEVEIFCDNPIADTFRGNTKQRRELHDLLLNGTEEEKLTALILSIYYVRCNLFHGSKSLENERDVELVKASSIIMEGYLSKVINNPVQKK